MVLFQDDTFAKITADCEFGMKVPMKEGRKLGASVYASLREYVRRNAESCAVVALEPTTVCPVRGPMAVVRRIEISPSFRLDFGTLVFPPTLTLNDELMKSVPLGHQRMTRPKSFGLRDRNGALRELVCEGFKTPYNTFLLVRAETVFGSLVFDLSPSATRKAS